MAEWTPWQKVADFEGIIYEKKYRLKGGGVARISFNRPKQLNAFTRDTIKELGAALDDASHDRTIGVVVLTGVGDRAFCTGGDINWEATPGELRRSFYYDIRPNDYVRMCRKPVIAAVNGWAVGGGHHLAYMCDFTIASETARFGQNGPRVGSPADGQLVNYLVRVVGAKKAREIWMLCRKYTAREALEMGLVNAVVPPDKLEEETDKWCDEILSLSPDCIEVLKAVFNSESNDLRGTDGVVSQLMLPDWFEGQIVKEAQQAFFEKREPDFWKFRPKPPISK